MHGDIMKKVIKVKYRNIFKYEDHQEVIKFDEKGYLEESGNHKIISFMTDKLIRIEIKANEIILYNGNSILRLISGRDVLNQYQTDYGEISLRTRLIYYEIGNTIKIKYELYDGPNLISQVYMMLSYMILEN
ncbi:DUF1934 domain-containing protein [Thomasclavelia cocleata]|uniref:DUF1934 domain-containing protein n=2 Tax=Thomasclavelia cocleata TaxID=69824 RepID=A0A1I0E231_9FIRM|nr:DUF1934 domain-containing protein [Thomasclavelia cocleata]PJN80722.1 DUF1934 domain-containing protein [Thomasclavelia cocleata]SET39123.1 protein of unknown function [Thomasclavelia cocleata]